MENKPLAQALFREVEIGDTIPEKFYDAMSIILAEVYKLGRKSAEYVGDGHRSTEYGGPYGGGNAEATG
jgi:hypothetical protein